MTTTTLTGPNYVITYEREQIDVTSSYPSPNERWTFTDSNGHSHIYAPGYPSLSRIIDEQHYCDGTEGFATHDPHWHIDRHHYECRECGEKIEPLMDPPFTPKHIAGAINATIEGTQTNGRTITAYLTQEQIDEITLTDPEQVQQMLNAMPDDQIIWSEIRS